jgi:hypothetical protein
MAEWRWVRLFPFSFARVRFCSQGISDRRVGVPITSQTEGRRFILEVRIEWNFVMRMFVKRGLSVLHFYECMRVGLLFFLIRIVGGGVQLGSLGTSATNWPIVPAAGDYEDGEFGGIMIGKGNRSTSILRKPAPVHHKSHMTWPGSKPGRRGGRPATNHFSYGTAVRPTVTRLKFVCIFQPWYHLNA